MLLLTWARLGVSTPFDPHHKFVSSPLLPPAALAALRLLLVLYAVASLCTVLAFNFGAALIVTIVFWALLSDGDTFETTFNTWSNTSLHALNTAYDLLDLLLSNSSASAIPHGAACARAAFGAAQQRLLALARGRSRGEALTHGSVLAATTRDVDAALEHKPSSHTGIRRDRCR
ncbi:hypothetical protein DFH09DRAFT_1503858 [Mycena vulgaris]|nr:hypothetical protein DFH09DRAFT_1503858 [Mycena vulgaris]